MMTALEILAATASTFTQIPLTPPVSLQHPSLLYPFEEHSCRFDQTHPTSKDIREVRKRCQALLKVMEQQERVSGAISMWTEDLMGAINILGNNGLNDETFETTYRDFKAVQHLFFVPHVLDLTGPYMSDNSINSNKPIHFAQYQPTITRSTSPSESICLAPPLTSNLQDPDHPREGWVQYDGTQPYLYPIVFLNKEGQAETAQYISYRSINEDTHLVGICRKGAQEYSTPLHTQAFPSPNFNRAGIKDTDLNIFHPLSTNQLLVDNALIDLKDPGVIADIHRYQAYQIELENVKWQKVELANAEDCAQDKLLTMERYLTHAVVHTRLLPHLLRMRPPSPPTIFPSPRIHIPRVFAGQGPPNSDDEDTDMHTILGKRLCHRPQKPVFPYCLKCNKSGPNHPEDLCPLWKMCRWCMSTQHSHDECPSPHLTCELKRCVVTYDHPNYGLGCPALPSSTLAYKMQLAAWDYNGELYKNAT